jgi:hypothetical protein
VTPAAKFGKPRAGTIVALKPTTSNLISGRLRSPERGLRFSRGRLEVGEDNRGLTKGGSGSGGTTGHGGGH